MQNPGQTSVHRMRTCSVPLPPSSHSLPPLLPADVVFMSINEPFRLVLSDVRARLQHTK